jgi:hypothetical protein
MGFEGSNGPLKALRYFHVDGNDEHAGHPAGSCVPRDGLAV